MITVLKKNLVDKILAAESSDEDCEADSGEESEHKVSISVLSDTQSISSKLHSQVGGDDR